MKMYCTIDFSLKTKRSMYQQTQEYGYYAQTP